MLGFLCFEDFFGRTSFIVGVPILLCEHRSSRKFRKKVRHTRWNNAFARTLLCSFSFTSEVQNRISYRTVSSKCHCMKERRRISQNAFCFEQVVNTNTSLSTLLPLRFQKRDTKMQRAIYILILYLVCLKYHTMELQDSRDASLPFAICWIPYVWLKSHSFGK